MKSTHLMCISVIISLLVELAGYSGLSVVAAAAYGLVLCPVAVFAIFKIYMEAHSDK